MFLKIHLFIVRSLPDSFFVSHFSFNVPVHSRDYISPLFQHVCLENLCHKLFCVTNKRDKVIKMAVLEKKSN